MVEYGIIQKNVVYILYMNTIIKKEFIEFEKYHKNIYNIYFHVLCGFFL